MANPRSSYLAGSKHSPVVAGALALSADIWTNDNDFLGTGAATWTTQSLQAWLDRS